jgi:hypothetical protein
MQVSWDIVDDWLYVSLSHWGMFRISAKNLIKLENGYHNTQEGNKKCQT